MRYFRFVWQVKMSPKTEELGTGTRIIVAKTEEEARIQFDKFLLEEGETPVAEPKMEELTIEQCIEEEEEEIRSRIRYAYILQQHGKFVTARQFNDLNKELKGKTETYWEALKKVNCWLSLAKFARKKLDLTKVTVAQFQDCLSMLLEAKTESEFNKVWRTLPKKSD